MMDPSAIAALELQQAISAKSTTKFEAFHRLQRHGWIHDTLQYCGAGRTGRWAGRGIQLQNLPSPKIPKETLANAIEKIRRKDTGALLEEYSVPLDAVASCIRATIKAPEGYLFGVCDLANIESRVLGWVSGCKRLNELFAAGMDPYKVFAEDWLGQRYGEVDKETRNICKPPSLGCGYGLGRGLQKYADSMGVALSDAQCDSAVKTYRSKYHEVPSFWKYLDNSVNDVLVGGRQDHPTFRVEGDFLTYILPSGRKLYYHKPEWEPGAGLTYMGQDQYTHKWQRLYTWGGKLTENIVQAIARDILYHGMRLIDEKIPVLGHVHDEVIALVPIWGAPEEVPVHLQQALAFMNSSLSATPWWCPGIVLGAEGYMEKRFKK